jgi:hypothetical protein
VERTSSYLNLVTNDPKGWCILLPLLEQGFVFFTSLHASRVPANQNHQVVSMAFSQAPVGCQAFAKHQTSEEVTESLGLSCRTKWVDLLLQGNEVGRDQDEVNLDITPQRQRPRVRVGGTGQLLPGHGRGARAVVSGSSSI